MNKKRVSAELKSTRSGFKKAIAINKSGGDIVVLTFFDFSNDLWGSCPAVTSIRNSIALRDHYELTTRIHFHLLILAL